MSKAHTFTFSATAVHVEQHDGYSTVSFTLFASPRVLDTVTVSQPNELAEQLSKWAYATPVPATDNDSNRQPNAWSISVRKPASGRWPQGFKQTAERSHTFVVNQNKDTQ